MAPLTQALSVQNVASRSTGEKESCWTGVIDLEWTVALVPNGGYVIGLVLEACIAHQNIYAPKVAEPVHITAHFLRPVLGVSPVKGTELSARKHPAPFDVHVKSVKSGSSINHVEAVLVQEGQKNVSTHCIFGVSLSSNTDPSKRKALVPPSPYARRIPLRTHPSLCADIVLHPAMNFRNRICGKEESVFQRLNKAENRRLSITTTGSESDQREPPGLEFGSWVIFKDEVGPLRPSMLPFCLDIIKPLPELLPREVNPAIGKSWYPTLTMTVEFKAPIRLDLHARHTFGLYSIGRFFQDPLGRHETSVEVWTAPPETRSDSENDSWREEQRCLAVATQTALAVPFDAQLNPKVVKVKI